MEWSNEKTTSFIHDFHNSPELWNNKIAEYKNIKIKKDKLKQLSRKHNCTVLTVKKKIKNLRSTFYREHKKVQQTDSGPSTKKGRWFAYDPLSFLLGVYKPKSTLSTGGSDEENFEFWTPFKIVFKWREDYTVVVLDLLKKEECLWNTKLASYRDKNLRDKALGRMAKQLNLLGVSAEDVKLKIKSIRTRNSCELGKVLLSERICASFEEVYRPKLFWFNQADMFLRSVCNPRLSLSTKDNEVTLDSVSDTEESGNQEAESLKKSIFKSEEEHIVEDPIIIQPIPSNVKRESSRNENVFVPEMSPCNRKRPFLGEPLETCSTTLGMKSEGISEFEAVGINIAKKLSKMEPMQAVLAESLISVILRKGLLNQLTEDTNCKCECNQV